MPPRINRTRERRIADEIIVDAYTPEERAMGWYYYIESRLPTPCTMTCIQLIAGSPFTQGEAVEVLRLAPESRCMSGLNVIARFAGRQVAVPLEQLQPDADDAIEAAEDWRYWKCRGYNY